MQLGKEKQFVAFFSYVTVYTMYLLSPCAAPCVSPVIGWRTLPLSRVGGTPCEGKDRQKDSVKTENVLLKD